MHTKAVLMVAVSIGLLAIEDAIQKLRELE
jgi:hypothetical protein